MKANFIKDRMQGLSLKKDDVMIIGVRPTTNKEKVQLVFLQNILRKGRAGLLAELNKGDERFGSSGRPFWVTVTLEGVKALVPEAYETSVKCVETGDYESLNIVNPEIHGSKIKIQLTETHRARKSDIQNLEQSAKQDGNGNYLTVDNRPIFTRVEPTYEDLCEHTFIEHNMLVSDVDELMISEEDKVEQQSNEDSSAEQAQTSDKEIVDRKQEVKEPVEA